MLYACNHCSSQYTQHSAHMRQQHFSLPHCLLHSQFSQRGTINLHTLDHVTGPAPPAPGRAQGSPVSRKQQVTVSISMCNLHQLRPVQNCKRMWQTCKPMPYRKSTELICSMHQHTQSLQQCCLLGACSSIVVWNPKFTA